MAAQSCGEPSPQLETHEPSIPKERCPHKIVLNTTASGANIHRPPAARVLTERAKNVVQLTITADETGKYTPVNLPAELTWLPACAPPGQGARGSRVAGRVAAASRRNKASPRCGVRITLEHRGSSSKLRRSATRRGRRRRLKAVARPLSLACNSQARVLKRKNRLQNSPNPRLPSRPPIGRPQNGFKRAYRSPANDAPTRAKVMLGGVYDVNFPPSRPGFGRARRLGRAHAGRASRRQRAPPQQGRSAQRVEA